MHNRPRKRVRSYCDMCKINCQLVVWAVCCVLGCSRSGVAFSLQTSRWPGWEIMGASEDSGVLVFG